MTRIALTLFALFASACATESDVAMDDASEELRATMEDIGMDEEQTAKTGRLAEAILTEYGELADQYGCDIVSIVYGAVNTRRPALSGLLMDTRGKRTGMFKGAIRSGLDNTISIVGATTKGTIEGSQYVFRGIVDGGVIEANFVSLGDSPDYEMFADLSTRGSRAYMKGVVADCN